MKLSQALRIQSGDVVALVGGGGKTTAMFQLARELAPTRRVLVTTTTRIFAAQIKQAPAHVAWNPEKQAPAEILPQLEAALARYGQVLLIGQVDSSSGKAFGLAPEQIDTLAAAGRVDVTIIEADGSRMRPLKAPAAHEPVIPASATLVVPVVGLDALGRPLDEEQVHRAGLVSQLSGARLGQPITPETVARLVSHPEGGLKGAPASAAVIPLVNKVDWQAGSQQAAARDVADKLLACERIEAVLLGAVQHSETPVLEAHSRVAAIVLAAGGSTRFGSPKQLARWGTKTFLEQVVDTALASQARPVVVVLGAEMEQCRAVLGNRPVEIVINPDWAEGQSTSMQAGLAALPARLGGALFMLVDLPGVTPAVLNQLIQRHRETLAPLVWPEFEGQRGNPVLFDRALFAELSQVSGDTGGRPVLLKYQRQAERVPVREQQILWDIDQPEDLLHLPTD